ncbi:prephenate dehydratase [Lachnoclostridium sp. Marseille-P6806]|uniref:prephenate dehydratase n=1 Tax=Lachnoclostridium sp. Marseille-P6806 TaxID=2364793 RepID=UPI001030A5F2|nr:prephenate dehydratase [Lachnoclostridium sp. Marseille-P6806]
MSDSLGELENCRSEIDEIDRQIVALYERRMSVSERVAAYKIRTGKKILDPAREQEKLRTLESLAHGGFNQRGVRELFQQIMSISRKKQYQLVQESGGMSRLPFIPVDQIGGAECRVVYQGAKGSYSEEALRRFFGSESASLAVESWRDAMTAIEEGSADYAVLPIENSTAGIVSQIYDLLAEYENYIVGEQILPVRHCLMGVPGTTLDSIRTVYSHAQSLMQSERFLSEHASWQQVSMQNNAFAAKKVAEDGDIHAAAIAGAYAAEAYGLGILAEGINSSETNSTRFIICTNQKVFRRDACKISLCLEIPHESGSLYRILSHFIYNDLSMNRIESRPIEGRNWEYRFFIDFEGNLGDSGVRNALRGLRDEARNLRILGNY